MAELNINIRAPRVTGAGLGAPAAGPGALGGSEVIASLREQQRILADIRGQYLAQQRIQARIVVEQREAAQEKLRFQREQATARRAERVELERQRRVEREGREAARAKAQAERDAAREQARSAREAARAQERAAEQARRAQERAARESQRAWERAAQRSAQAWQQGLQRIRRDAAGVGRSVGRVGSLVGGGVGGALGSIGLSPGSIVRAAGGLAGTGARVGGELVKGVASGVSAGIGVVGTALSAGVALIPKGGAFISGAVGIGTEMVGGIVKGIGGAVGAVADAVGGLIEGATQLAGTAVNAAAATLGAGFAIGAATSIKAARFDGLQTGFNALIESIGGDGPAALQGFRQAASQTGNALSATVSDYKLVQQANQAVLLGAIDNTSQFEKLIGASRRLGQAVGRDANSALSDLILGLGRQSRVILDNLGVIVNSEQAYKDYAAALGITSAALTDTQRRAAFMAAAMEGIDGRLNALGPEQENAISLFDSLKASLENISVQVGRVFLPSFRVVGRLVQDAAGGIQRFFSANSAALAERLAGAVRTVTDTIRNLVSVTQAEGLSGLFRRGEEAALAFWRVFVRSGRTAIDAIGDLLSALWARTKAEFIDAITEGFKFIVGTVTGLGPIGKALGFDDIQLPGNARADRLREEAGQRLDGALVKFQLALLEGGQGLRQAAIDAGAALQQPSIVPRARSINEFIDRSGSGGTPLVLAPTAGAVASASGAAPRTTTVPTVSTPAPVGVPAAASLGSGLSIGGGAGAGLDAELRAIRTADRVAVATRALEAAVGGFDQLPPAVQKIIDERLTRLAEGREEEDQNLTETERFIRRLEEDRRRKIADAVEESARAEVAAVRERVSTFERLERERERSVERLNEERVRLNERLAEQTRELQERLSQQIQETIAATREALQRNLQQARGSRTDAILGDRDRLPLNVRKGLEKIDRDRDRARKDALKRQFSGLSSEDIRLGRGRTGSFSFAPPLGGPLGLSDPNDFQLTQAQVQAPQRVRGRAAAVADKEIEAGLDQELLLEQQRIVAEATKRVADLQTEATKKQTELATETAGAVETISATLERQNDALESAKSQLEKFRAELKRQQDRADRIEQALRATQGL